MTMHPQPGTLCRRRQDGKRYRVVWVLSHAKREPVMVQLRRVEATNLKNTIWVQLDNFDRLYERIWVAER